jgi:cytochrome c5
VNVRPGFVAAAATGVAVTIGFLAGSIVRPVAAQATRNVWDGVYNSGQAARGKRLYVDSCSSCHKEGLQGADLAPALRAVFGGILPSMARNWLPHPT